MGARPTMLIIIKDTADHAEIIKALYFELFKIEKKAAMMIAKVYKKAIVDVLQVQPGRSIKISRSLQVDMMIDLLDAINRHCADGGYFGTSPEEPLTFAYRPIPE